MKLTALILSAIITGVGSAAVWAADCVSSFYCYGGTADSVTRVATRPPPIPPPNPRVAQQRRQQQLALRNDASTPRPANNTTHTTPRTTTRANVGATSAQGASPRATQPPQQPRITTRTPPAPPARATVRPIPRQPAANITNCQKLNDNAAQLESQAVIASKQGDRDNSVRLFREAARLRGQACR